MDKFKKAKKLSELIVRYGNGEISRDSAELTAFRYYANEPKQFLKRDHTSITQLANNFAIVMMMKSKKSV